MTTSQIIACAISWTSAAVAVWSLIRVRRAGRELRARQLAFPVGGGVITFPQRLSDAEVAEFRARWRETYGKPGAVVEVRNEEEQP